MRKLATIRRIDAIDPIPGADAIEVATVGGWKVVAKKGEYKPGDMAVYCEVDSWIPSKLAPFLTRPGHFPKTFEGIEGERLKTIRLRGQLSQGLLLNLDQVIPETHQFGEDSDVTEYLGIVKWEKAMPAQLAGTAKGNFPSLIPKTDQERVQNLKKEIEACQGLTFEVTEKYEGSSMTVYRSVGDSGEMEFGVCSRNLNLKEVEGNTFWDVARAEDIEAKMIAVDEFWSFAIQGELIGPGIQGNIYGLTKPQFCVFDVYDIQTGKYLPPKARRELIERMGLRHVAVLNEEYVLTQTVEEIIATAEGQSTMAATEREGIVFKQVDGGITFKAISNRYLLNEK